MESSSSLFEISIPRGALENNKMMYLLKINNIIAVSHTCKFTDLFYNEHGSHSIFTDSPHC